MILFLLGGASLSFFIDTYAIIADKIVFYMNRPVFGLYIGSFEVLVTNLDIKNAYIACKEAKNLLL